ncbi:MAG TPA: tRNA pseudouridine(55) synthase TruB [Gemmatimonadaceae bacterium]|nr:tRNA pseudouridine(55) synthase TruB [Gemmatimonadaceae bacterium]
MLLVDKPPGITSHDVVSAARRALATRRIGHGGTLDPFATGLLVLLIGHATRLLPYLDGEPKVYEAVVAFGAETDTDDATGAVVRTADLPSATRVREALRALTGSIDQLPPAYSAKQVGGRRAYDAARRGAPLALEPTRVTVHEWRVDDLQADRLRATITCAGGTYIRALARDLGRLCDSAAHLEALRRTRSGAFHIEDAVPLEALESGAVEVRPPLAAVSQLPTARLSDENIVHVRHGRAIPAGTGAAAASVAMIDDRGRLVALAERDGATWQPRVVLPDA